MLEQFAHDDASTGIRIYEFPLGQYGEHGPTLRSVGKQGQLRSVYLPVHLSPCGAPELTRSQIRVVDAIFRETTRALKTDRKRVGTAAVFRGAQVPSADNKRKISCPRLQPTGRYVEFNGNSKRRGLGYYLCTAGGWLTKAGYPLDAVDRYLDDLAVLSDRLGFLCVAIHRSRDEWLTLPELRSLQHTPSGRRRTQEYLLRIYTDREFLQRWNALFQWPPSVATDASDSDTAIISIAATMKEQRIRGNDLANGLGIDASFLSKILRGRKPPPPGLLQRAHDWISHHAGESSQADDLKPPLPAQLMRRDEGSLVDVALFYLTEWQWSVIPQRAGEKRPAIRWKAYQSTRPTEAMIRSWYADFPDAGIAVVLGPVSDLFGIDVDGQEAHEELIRRLGSVPLAPMAISGSGQPYRYHLFFRYPRLVARAREKPWHEKLEFRGRGRLLLLPPSLHPSGNRYQWAEGRSPSDVLLTALPAPILEAIAAPARPASVPSSAQLQAADELSSATQRFLRGDFRDGPQWNSQLFQAACDMHARGHAIAEAMPRLLEGAAPWSDTERATAITTIRSAFAEQREPSRA